MAAQYLKKEVRELTPTDEFLVQQLETELAGTITLGTTGAKSDFKIHIDKGLPPIAFIKDKVDELQKETR